MIPAVGGKNENTDDRVYCPADKHRQTHNTKN
jgi:hypothetical protein